MYPRFLKANVLWYQHLETCLTAGTYIKGFNDQVYILFFLFEMSKYWNKIVFWPP